MTFSRLEISGKCLRNLKNVRKLKKKSPKKPIIYLSSVVLLTQ